MTSPLPINWPDDGLIPAVVQDTTSGEVLMVGFLNETALEVTRETGFVHFWSRSRQKLWKKGETSGHVQHVQNIYVNCEQNSVLIEAEQTGAVCHDGYPTCYYRRLEDDNALETVRDRWFDPTDVYGNREGLKARTRLWWGAYEYLKSEDLADISGTSRAIQNAGKSVIPRIQDELRELAGVLDGSHMHTNQRDDLLLEGSQVSYWIALEAIRTGHAFDDVRPDRALDSDETAPSTATMTQLLHATADQLSLDGLDSAEIHDLLSIVASACRAINVDPIDVIERDLVDLRSRDYLAPYFAR